MKGIAKLSIWIAVLGAVIGGISRLTVVPIILTSRTWFGLSVILLLFSIALMQVYEK
ncbi:hypothetical protein ACFLTD_04770 [Elusimicrobiota bacterium]